MRLCTCLSPNASGAYGTFRYQSSYWTSGWSSSQTIGWVAGAGATSNVACPTHALSIDEPPALAYRWDSTQFSAYSASGSEAIFQPYNDLSGACADECLCVRLTIVAICMQAQRFA